jgi:hypothetical protein
MPVAIFACGFILTLVGAFHLAKVQKAARLALLTVPMMLAVFASALQNWLLITRFMLWTAPIIALLIAAGLWRLTAALGHRARLPAFSVAGAMLVFVPARYMFYVARHPEQESQREAVRQIQNAFRPGDVVYVYSRALPAWAFYTTDWRAPELARLQRLFEAMQAAGPNSGNAPRREQPVHHEGFNRQYSWKRGTELAGVADGVFNQFMFWWAQQTGASVAEFGMVKPTSTGRGWAEYEASRIRTASSSVAWILTAGQNDFSLAELLAAVTATGADATQTWTGRQASVFRLQFKQ